MTFTEPDVTDFDPIGAENSPDINDASFRAWELQMEQGAPRDFVQAVAPAFESLPVWFETPATTAAIALRETRDYVATFVNPRDGNYNHTVLQYAKDPAWQLHLAGGYVARMVRAQDGRTSVMHQVMRRSIDILRAATQNGIRALQTQIHNTNVAIVNEAHARTTQIANTVKVLRVNIANGDKATLQAANAWSLTHVAKPIEDAQAQDRKTFLQGLAKEHADAQAYTDLKIAAALAPVTAALAVMQRQMNALQTENDTCVQPMCETMGPNTDLGKLLKAFNVAKWLAILAALETIDVKTLEAFAAEIAGTEGRIGEWVASAVLGELQGG